MMKIVVLDGYTLNPGDLSWERIKKLGDCTIYDRTAKHEVIERMRDAEIVLTNKTVIDKEAIESCSNLKYIGVLATGYNVVDVKSAAEKAIVVTNVPAYSTDSVSQLIFAHILHICHHVSEHNQSVKRGDWSKSEDFCYWNYPLMELTDKTLGVIGLGAIGYKTAKIAESFGMKVLAYSRNPKKELETENLKYCELDDLYKNSDIISLNCSLSESTEKMINKTSIAKMKDGVILINTSRGGLVNEKDLADALNSKKISMAGIDVVSVEPISENNPLLQAENCIITPHIAWAVFEARARLMSIASANIEAFLEAKSLNVIC